MKEVYFTFISWIKSSSTGVKLSFFWLLCLFLITIFLGTIPHIQDPNAGDLSLPYVGPFQTLTYPLGTDQLGRDLLTLLVHGVQTACILTFPPLFAATIAGMLLGSAAALLGNHRVRITIATLLSVTIHFFILLYLIGIAPWWEAISLIALPPSGGSFLNVLILLCFTYGLRKALFLIPVLRNEIRVPVDEVILKCIDVWSTLPKLLLLLLLTTFSSPSLWVLGGWIALSYWVAPARLVRARILQLKNKPFVESAYVLGIPSFRIITKHLWPSLSAPIVTNFLFDASGLMGIGSTLAFLGIGIPADVPSWGKLLSISRYSFEAWWLFAFPATLLLFSIFSLQTLGPSFLKR